MKTTSAPSYSIRIYMAGNLAQAEQVCREFCWDGACVTVTPTNYIYKGGEESGFVVGFINYPRFPKTTFLLNRQAESLAERLMTSLCQSSYTIETPAETTWYSRREDDDAQKDAVS
jgi:hypothetical protein